jgi:hypothetical protein
MRSRPASDGSGRPRQDQRVEESDSSSRPATDLNSRSRLDPVRAQSARRWPLAQTAGWRPRSASCCVKHAHVSQTFLASLYVYRLNSLLVLHISTYVLHLYKQRSNKIYSCSRLIKPAQATRAQKPASSNVAAQALCEPAPSDATKSIANFNTGFYRLFQISNIGNICY